MSEAERLCKDADREIAQGLKTLKQQQESLASKEAELKALQDSMEPLLELIP